MSKGFKIFLISLTTVVFIFVMALMITLNQKVSEAWFPVFSSHYTNQHGIHAFFRNLEDEGLPTEQNYYRLYDTEGDPRHNLVVMAPYKSYHLEEQDSLLARVAHGSYLIACVQGDNNFLQEFGIQLADAEDNEYLDGDLEVRQATPSPVFSKVNEISYLPEEVHGLYNRDNINDGFAHYFVSDTVGIVPLLEDQGRTLIGSLRWGLGKIILVSHPYIFTNEGLKKGDNARLATALFKQVYAEHPGTFLFDEFHQGLGKEKVNSPLNEPEVRWMIWALLISFGIAVYSLSKRRIRPVPLIREPRRTAKEFISSVGNIYARKGAGFFLFREVSSRFFKRLKVSLKFHSVKELKNLERVRESARRKWGSEDAEELIQLIEEIKVVFEEKKKDRMLETARKIRQFSIKNKLDLHGHV